MRPDPRQLFESQRRLVAPDPRPVPTVTPRRELDELRFSLELSTRRHGTDEAKSVIHVGEGRVTRDDGHPGLQFAVPASIFTALMLDDVPLDIYADLHVSGWARGSGACSRRPRSATVMEIHFSLIGSKCLARDKTANAADS